MTLCRKRRNKRKVRKMGTYREIAKRKLGEMVDRGYRATASQERSYRRAAKAAGMSPSMIDDSLWGITTDETRRERLHRERNQGMVIA